ncbi:MAG: O-antigen polymerase [bacterium]
MIYILLFLLIIIILKIYILNGRNILSVSLVYTSMFILSSLIVSFSIDYFQVDISFYTIIVIIASIFFLFGGEIVANTVMLNKCQYSTFILYKHEKKYPPIKISNNILLFICLFMFVITLFNLYNTYKISLVIGNPENIFDVFRYARRYIISNQYQQDSSIILGQLTVFSNVLAYYSLYVYLYNKILAEYNRKRYLIPVFIHLVRLMSLTGRNSYIRFITLFCIYLFIFIKERVAWSNRKDIKILKTSILSLVFFIIFFRMFGNLTGSGGMTDFWENITIYLGSSIIGLDIYLESNDVGSIIFGQYTLINVYAFLRKFAIDIPLYRSFNEFFTWPNGSSNIYTSLMRFIQDYTIWGMFFIQFWIGYFYTRYLQKIRFKRIGKSSFVSITILGIMFYPIVMASIENVFSTILSMSFVYHIVYLLLIDYVFKRKFTINKSQIQVYKVLDDKSDKSNVYD